MRREVDRAVIFMEISLILSCGRKAAVEGYGPRFRSIRINSHALSAGATKIRIDLR
jgi:hypothetical protein